MTGEIHAWVGENGAGKSTLAAMIAGNINPDNGEILIDGMAVKLSSPRSALQQGIVLVHQESSLVDDLTVAQNLFLGREQLYLSARKLHRAANTLLNTLGYQLNPDAKASSLSKAQRQIVEICRAVSLDASLIIFDEPTASLTETESRILLRLFKQLAAQGISIVFISHALEQLMAVADRISVFRDGKLIKTAATRHFDRARLIELMIGRPPLKPHSSRARSQPSLKTVVTVEDIGVRDLLTGISITINQGEILGLGGLVGAGRSELGKTIAGVLAYDQGKMTVHGKPRHYRHPGQAIQDGLVYITENRNRDGLFTDLPLSDNLYISDLLSRRQRPWFYSTAKQVSLTRLWLAALNISPAEDKLIRQFSGGNQQKALIAKALIQAPDIIVFDEPTHGVDVSVIPQIWQQILELKQAGKAVILISSYLPELLVLSDRLLVMRDGKLIAEFNRDNASETAIMQAATC
jgi:simple sugar transport system ATP-binding protein